MHFDEDLTGKDIADIAVNTSGQRVKLSIRTRYSEELIELTVDRMAADEIQAKLFNALLGREVKNVATVG